VGRAAYLWIEDDLGDSVAVAEVDEHAAAVVASDIDPPGEDNALSDMCGAQLTAAMSFLVLGEKASHAWGQPYQRC
jgi:hypothetical protein